MTTSEIIEDEINPDVFAKLVLHYSHNAEKYLLDKDYQKASEMMWGAMSCLIKTVAAKEKKSIKSHRELIKYANELSKKEKDENFFESLSKASLLHRNFYESNLDPDQVLGIANDVSKTVGTLMQKMEYDVKLKIPTAEYTICPNCQVTASSRDEIDKKFGFRNAGGINRPQSLCKNCRRRH